VTGVQTCALPIWTRIHHLLPRGGIVGPVVETFDALEVQLYVRAVRCVDMHYGVNVRVHRLLNQRCVEMPRVQGNKPYGPPPGFFRALFTTGRQHYERENTKCDG